MKPEITFFGEELPEAFFKAMAKDVDRCDLVVVVGTSLKVRGAARLARAARLVRGVFLASPLTPARPCARVPGRGQRAPPTAPRGRRGAPGACAGAGRGPRTPSPRSRSLTPRAPQVLINRDAVAPPPAISDGFDLSLLGDCDDVVRFLCGELGWPLLPTQQTHHDDGGGGGALGKRTRSPEGGGSGRRRKGGLGKAAAPEAAPAARPAAASKRGQGQGQGCGREGGSRQRPSRQIHPYHAPAPQGAKKRVRHGEYG